MFLIKSAPGGGPEAQLMKNDRFYKLFRATGAKYTINIMVRLLFDVPKHPPGDPPGPSLWGTLGGPKTQLFDSKMHIFWMCDRSTNGPKNKPKQQMHIKHTKSQHFGLQHRRNTITHNVFFEFCPPLPGRPGRRTDHKRQGL